MSTTGAISTALLRAGIGEVLEDSTTTAAYSSDASLYRVTPLVVVRPRDSGEVAATLAVCRDHGVALTARGAGTSIAGNAVGAGVVLDFSRHMNKVLALDPEARTAVVQPGTVHAVLQRAAATHGLRFGPDPSTHSRCTIGGMIGNNACGSRTLAYGRTSDNVHGLRLITGSGIMLDLPRRPEDSPAGHTELTGALQEVIRGGLATIRTEFGRFGRQVSGYALEHLLPERGVNLTRFLTGTEGTLAITTEATVRLVTEPRHRLLVVLGYPDIAAAGDDIPAILPISPTACEGLDSRIVDVVRQRHGPDAVPALPSGSAWLFVEISGTFPQQVRDTAGQLIIAAHAVDSLIVDDPGQAVALWRIREDGAGLSGRSPAGLPAHAGWEDAAVPPAVLGKYLRDFDALMTEFGVTGLPYGHFGDGCLHIRLDFPLHKPDGPAVLRRFLLAAGQLVAGYGGSLSGEHGDGRARSELLPLMYSRRALDLFGAVKHVFDPDNLLNPGVIVDPHPLDADLRAPGAPPLRTSLALAYHHDGGDFSQAVHRCTGVGKCRADNTAAGGVMCPSYLATGEEIHSTRGRARVLQEMINGTNVSGGWRSPEVHQALDLCLSCKGCLADCPTGVDMAAYKSEVLHQTHRGRLRPASHYSLGWLPRWANLASRAPALINGALRIPGLAPLALSGGGVDRRRTVPVFAKQTFRNWFHRTRHERRVSGDPVLLFVDSFTNYFTPEVGRATVRLLEDAGYRPQLTSTRECCALTWISTGQLTAAKKILGRTVEALATCAPPGTPIVGIEPSCTGVLRSDATELVGSPAATAVAERTHTLAELLTMRGWAPPSLDGTRIVAQVHCHHNSIMGWVPDAKLLETAGAQVQRLGGCCGLAGNFGVEKGHYETSVTVAELQLLPAARDAPQDAVFLTDGYSCRTQLRDLTPRRGRHLAELLSERMDQALPPLL